MTTKHVYLGRFAPFQNGHKHLLSELIERFGIENILVLVGSSNALNQRTPYSYEDRKQIINISFPEVEVLPLPDGKPDLDYFDGSTNEVWLDNLERIAKNRNERFIFYGGCDEDLEILAERFETKILVDRFGPGLGLSATKVRELIASKNFLELTNYVDKKAVQFIIEKFRKL